MHTCNQHSGAEVGHKGEAVRGVIEYLNKQNKKVTQKTCHLALTTVDSRDRDTSVFSCMSSGSVPF